MIDSLLTAKIKLHSNRQEALLERATNLGYLNKNRVKRNFALFSIVSNLLKLGTTALSINKYRAVSRELSKVRRGLSQNIVTVESNSIKLSQNEKRIIILTEALNRTMIKVDSIASKLNDQYYLEVAYRHAFIEEWSSQLSNIETQLGHCLLYTSPSPRDS